MPKCTSVATHLLLPTRPVGGKGFVTAAAESKRPVGVNVKLGDSEHVQSSKARRILIFTCTSGHGRDWQEKYLREWIWLGGVHFGRVLQALEGEKIVCQATVRDRRQ